MAKQRRFATGGLGELGSYEDSAFGNTFNKANPYTYGQAGSDSSIFTPQAISLGSGLNSSSTSQGSLIPYTDPNYMSLSSMLSDSAKFYLDKKWGLWKNSDQDTGVKGVADTLSDINTIIKYKGGTPVSSPSQIDTALAPLIKKRNAKVGLGGVLGMVAPIALSFALPGIGTALGGALGMSTAAGTALAGAGLGALTSGLTGSNPLLGAALGGFGGYLQGAGGLSGVAKSMGYGKIGASGLANTVGKLGTGLSNLSSSLGGGSNALGNLSGLSKLAMLTQQPTSGSGYSDQDRAALTNLLQQQQAMGGNTGPNSIFYKALGKSNYAEGGRIIKGPGDGMSDSIPATISGVEPIRVADGEHIVPALQVSMLGRGSSDAGSKRVEQLVQKELKKIYGKNVDPIGLQNKAMRTK